MKLNQIIDLESVAQEMVLIPTGEFTMGAESIGWGDSEYPAHRIYISEFLMDTHHVTNGQFREFVEATGYQTTAEKKGAAYGYEQGAIKLLAGLCWRSYATEDRTNHPVILVSWLDATTYCQWADKRLPTEAEWEFSARGGLPGQLYPWGDKEPSAQNCNMARTTVDVPPTTPVKTFPSNGYGLYDMAGNVWDLCADKFDPAYYAVSPTANPKGPEEGELIVRRGASFNIIQHFRCRNANRGAFPKDGYAINVGFRCAKTI